MPHSEGGLSHAARFTAVFDVAARAQSDRAGNLLHEHPGHLAGLPFRDVNEIHPRRDASFSPWLNVESARWLKIQFNRRGHMKTKWGSCNYRGRHIRLNTELVKKPKDLLEYVVVHEMLHLIEPNHSERFVKLLTQHYPTWREARADLNELPLSAEVWRE